MDDKTKIEVLERELRAHRTELDILIGRTNALHEVLIQFALDRENSTEVLMNNLSVASERSIADMLQANFPDLALNEHRRVTQEFVAFLNNARLGLQKPDEG